ncbi:MAG: hypothetical protein ABIT16_03630 [Croceibacterium sp.]
MRYIGALLIAYFLSRGFALLGLRHPPVYKLLAGHVLSLGVAVLTVIALRYPANAYDSGQLVPYVVGQFFWLLFDLYRSRVAIWKAPEMAKEPSAKAP